MRIGELGEAAGVDVDTIRYYEKIGVLPPPARQSNGYRAYGPTHVKRLMFVRHCRALDMPLAEVQRLLGWTDSPQAPCADVDALIDKQLLRVRERLASLQQLEAQLSDLRACCAEAAERGDNAEACGILSDLMSAAQGKGCACHHEHLATAPLMPEPLHALREPRYNVGIWCPCAIPQGLRKANTVMTPRTPTTPFTSTEV